jgi:hypothetical protein
MEAVSFLQKPPPRSPRSPRRSAPGARDERIPGIHEPVEETRDAREEKKKTTFDVHLLNVRITERGASHQTSKLLRDSARPTPVSRETISRPSYQS